MSGLLGFILFIVAWLAIPVADWVRWRLLADSGNDPHKARIRDVVALVWFIGFFAAAGWAFNA